MADAEHTIESQLTCVLSRCHVSDHAREDEHGEGQNNLQAGTIELSQVAGCRPRTDGSDSDTCPHSQGK